MAATIRLMRFGKKGYPTYRVVVLDKRKKRDGSYIEKIGTFQPMTAPGKLELIKERFEYWQSRGAQMSEGISKLLKSKNNVVMK
jgi:small subunit ribosomal protein S16